jgi:hypothetical protein
VINSLSIFNRSAVTFAFRSLSDRFLIAFFASRLICDHVAIASLSFSGRLAIDLHSLCDRSEITY